ALAASSFAAARSASQLEASLQARSAAARRVRPRRAPDRLSIGGDAPSTELDWSSHRLAACRAGVAGVPHRGRGKRVADSHPPTGGTGMVAVECSHALLRHRTHPLVGGRPGHLPPPRAVPHLHRSLLRAAISVFLSGGYPAASWTVLGASPVHG